MVVAINKIEAKEILPNLIGVVNIPPPVDWKIHCNNLDMRILHNNDQSIKMRQSFDVYLQKHEFFKQLTDQFYEYSNKWLDSLLFRNRVFISTCWLNIFEKGQYVGRHHHNNSLISGVYYFEECSGIKFTYPESKSDFRFTEALQGKHIHKPKAGDLILYFSTTPHESLPCDKERRYSMAFNCFPTVLGDLYSANCIDLRKMDE